MIYNAWWDIEQLLLESNNCTGNSNGFPNIRSGKSPPAPFHTIRLEDISQIIWTSFKETECNKNYFPEFPNQNDYSEQ